MYCMQNQAESPASVLSVWGGCTVLGGDKGRKINGTRIMPAKYFFQTKKQASHASACNTCFKRICFS